MASFRTPSHLLCSMTEPQWLPPLSGERESSLDVLERNDERRIAALKASVLPEPVEPIGIAGVDERKAELAVLLRSPDSVDLKGTTVAAQQPSFWVKYRQRHEEMKRDAAISKLEDRSDADGQEQDIKPGRLSTGSAMSMNSSLSSALGSPLHGDVKTDSSNLKLDESGVDDRDEKPGRLSTGSAMSLNSSLSSTLGSPHHTY